MTDTEGAIEDGLQQRPIGRIFAQAWVALSERLADFSRNGDMLEVLNR